MWRELAAGSNAVTRRLLCAMCAGALQHWHTLVQGLRRVREALAKLLLYNVITSLRRHMAGWGAATLEVKWHRHVKSVCRSRSEYRVTRLLHAHFSQWRLEQLSSFQSRHYHNALLQWSHTQTLSTLKIVARRRGRELVVEAGTRRRIRETVVFEAWLLVAKRARVLAFRYLSLAVAHERCLVLSAFWSWRHATERERVLRRREWSSLHRRSFFVQAASFSCWLALLWRHQRLVRMVGARVGLADGTLLHGCLLEWHALALANVRRSKYELRMKKSYHLILTILCQEVSRHVSRNTRLDGIAALCAEFCACTILVCVCEHAGPWRLCISDAKRASCVSFGRRWQRRMKNLTMHI